MLITIFISIALLSGIVFGWYCATELNKQKTKKKVRVLLDEASTELLEKELVKREFTKNLPFK